MSRRKVTKQEALERLAAYAKQEKKLVVFASHFEKCKPHGVSRNVIKRLFGTWEAFALTAGLIAGRSEEKTKRNPHNPA